jgi:ribosomal protein S18 acetylase RimI-like enzyme
VAHRDPTEHVFELTGCFGVRLDEGRAGELQEFYERCRDYFELVTGQPPSPTEARELLAALPRGKSQDDKFVVGLFDAPGHLVGVLDVIRDFPKPREWYLGLLMFEPTLRGQKLGDRVYHRLEEWVAAQGGASVHLIVEEVNPRALNFWQRMGFEVQGMGKRILKGRESVFLRMTREIVRRPEPVGTFIPSWLSAWLKGKGESHRDER